MTAPDLRTTRPDRETRCSCQTAACGRRAGPSSPRLPGCTVTFRCGRRTRHSSISSRVRCRTNWTSGASAPAGGTPERITSHNGRVSYPVLLDRRTLMYLASDPDGSGPWLYSMDVERRIPHRLTSGLDRYTSLAASADGRRLVATLASPKRTLWRLRIRRFTRRGDGGGSHFADDQHGVLPAIGAKLSAVCFGDRREREYLEVCRTEWERNCGVVRERESLAARRLRPMERHRVLGAATRADDLVRDAG